MSEPLLSICIPTYNRAIFLKRMCESISAQLDEEILNQLEICISDNASTDNTSTVVNDFIIKYPKNVTYKINNNNYGGIYNIFQVLKIAKGEYLLCIGDDDIFIDGAIAYLLRLIMQIKNDAEIKIIFAKYNAKVGNKVVFKAFGALQSEKIYYKGEIEEYFIKDKFWSNGFLGAQIFHKDIVKDYFDNLVRQDNSNLWPHLSILLHNFKILKKIIVSKPIVYQIGDGLYWLRANWILALFGKVEVLDTALSKKEITEYMATKTCSSILFSFTMSHLAIAAKIEKPARFSFMVKKISAYKSNNSNMQLRINIFKIMLNAINFIPSLPLETMYSFCIKVFGMKDIRMGKNGPAVISKNKREALSVIEVPPPM